MMHQEWPSSTCIQQNNSDTRDLCSEFSVVMHDPDDSTCVERLLIFCEFGNQFFCNLELEQRFAIRISTETLFSKMTEGGHW